jgi:hypothetical protein
MPLIATPIASMVFCLLPQEGSELAARVSVTLTLPPPPTSIALIVGFAGASPRRKAIFLPLGE